MKRTNALTRFNLGLIISLSTVLVALEWKSYSNIVDDGGFSPKEIHPVEEDFREILFRLPEKPEPLTKEEEKPKPETDQIEVVPDKKQVAIKKAKTKTKIDFNVDSLWVPEIIIETEPLRAADVRPEFNGGDKAMYQYLYSKINYSEKCRDVGAEGRVYVEFVVSKKGKVRNTKVLRGIKYCKNLEEQVVKAVKEMPTWKPGKQKGHPVDCYFTLPVEFKLK